LVQWRINGQIGTERMTTLKAILCGFSSDLCLAGRTLRYQFLSALLAVVNFLHIDAVHAFGTDFHNIMFSHRFSCTQGLLSTNITLARKRGGFLLRQDEFVTGRGFLSIILSLCLRSFTNSVQNNLSDFRMGKHRKKFPIPSHTAQ